MNSTEKYFARLIVQQRILVGTGFAYQDFFSLAMEHHNGQFVKVKPQGQLGDQKNDGYDPSTGTYFQVYSPEGLDDKVASRKLIEDFVGVKHHWNGETPIKHFRYVVNDRYKGSYPTVEHLLATLRKDHAPITFDLFRAKDLEDLILNLSDDKITAIVGPLESTKGVASLDVSALGIVIKFLLQSESTDIPDVLPENPDFDKKLKFNGLSTRVSARLKSASYQTQLLEEYFDLNSAFAKDDLKSKFSALYSAGKESALGTPDAIYFHILEKASPSTAIAIRNAVEVLMAYYFEYCDIFEAPPA